MGHANAQVAWVTIVWVKREDADALGWAFKYVPSLGGIELGRAVGVEHGTH
jgi:hypothetical protein